MRTRGDCRALIYGFAVAMALLAGGCPAADANMTATQARRLALELNLHGGDLPRLFSHGERTFYTSSEPARCRVLPSTRPLAFVSRIFAASVRPGAPYMTSNVMIWPSAHFAGRRQAALAGPRGLRCLKAEAAQILGGPGARLTVRRLSAPTTGGAWLRLKQTLVAGRLRQVTYYDELSFARGPASVEVDGISRNRPFSPRLLGKAERILVARARRYLPVISASRGA